MFTEGQKVTCRVMHADGKEALQPGIVLRVFDQPARPLPTKYNVFVAGVVMLLNEDELAARE